MNSRPGDALALAAQLDAARAGRRRGRRRRARRRASRPCARTSRRTSSSTSSARQLGARAELERELLELAQQPLLAVADAGDERAGGAGVELEAELRRPCSATQRGSSFALTAASSATTPPAGLTALPSAAGHLVAPLLAGEEGDGQRLGVDARQRGDDRLDLGVLPALDAVGDHEAPAHGEGHRAERAGDRARACRSRPRRPRRRCAPLSASASAAQLRAALGDAAVVVAVDQVGGLEGGHSGESTRALGGDASVASPRLIAAAAPTAQRAGGSCRRGRCGRRAARRAAPRASPASDGRRCCRAPTSIAATCGRSRSSCAGRPGSSLPWWATLSASTRREVERGRSRRDSASAGSSRSKPPLRRWATSGAVVRVAGRRSARAAARRPEDVELAARRAAAVAGRAVGDPAPARRAAAAARAGRASASPRRR